MLFVLLLQWICVPFVLTDSHVQDIGQTLTNNSVHAPWMGEVELKNTWMMIDNFLFFVRRPQTHTQTWRFWPL